MSSLRKAAQQALEALLLTYSATSNHCDAQWQAITALKAALAEPVQEPMAWIHTDPDQPRVKFLEWREDEPGYRGRWIKTPLYTEPKRGEPVQGCPSCEYNKQRAQLWRNEAYKLGGHPLDWEPELMVRPKPPCATGDCIPSKCNICEVKE